MTTTSVPERGALSPKRAAEYIDSTEGTLAKWRYQGVGPPYLKIRGKVLYRLASLDSYLLELEQEQMKAV